jgi:hypothetical protein
MKFLKFETSDSNWSVPGILTRSMKPSPSWETNSTLKLAKKFVSAILQHKHKQLYLII